MPPAIGSNGKRVRSKTGLDAGYFLGLQSPDTWHITSFYRFHQISPDRLEELQTSLTALLLKSEMRGLVLLATEGVNGTIAGSSEAVASFKTELGPILGILEIHYKDSISAKRPFRHLSVEIRAEIVGLKRPDLVPEKRDDTHLSPREWQAWLDSDREKMVIDTRNRYELLAGRFKGAIDPDLGVFSEWPEYLDRAEISKDIPVLLYCTGGIRCEKAILEMNARGYDRVYQLQGGILSYLAEFPNASFDGECFVFDDRVAVDQYLNPSSKIGICPGCGLTACELVPCESCGKHFYSCEPCRAKRPNVCSKPCLDLWRQQARRKAKLTDCV